MLLKRIKQPSVEFQIPLNGNWVSVDRFLQEPNLLIKHYLYGDFDYDFEILEGGFFISADGKPWNSENHVESFSNAEWWLDGIRQACNSSDRIFVHVWEETNLYIWHKDKLLFMKDDTHHRHVRLPQVCFEFEKFVDVFLPEAEKFARLVDCLGPLIADLPDPKSDPLLKTRVDCLKECYPDLDAPLKFKTMYDALQH